MVETTILVDSYGLDAPRVSECIHSIAGIFNPFRCTYEILFFGLKNTLAGMDLNIPGPQRVSCAPFNANDRYGDALRKAFGQAQGNTIFMADENLLLSRDYIAKIWKERTNAETVIASRYCPGSLAVMPRHHFLFSRFLNRAFKRILSLPVSDISTGLRLYHRSILKEIKLDSHDYDILLEILVKTYIHGYAIKEVPVAYRRKIASRNFSQNARLFFTFLATACKMWKLRNTIEACDYDERAYASPIFFQRYWQRKRHAIIVNAAANLPHVLDIGCGSSRILFTLPDAVGMDIDIKKIRYMRRYDNPVLCGSTFQLPFKNGTFDGVISSEVIEHVKKDESIWTEMRRVLKPGGTLILGTPDYGSKLWVFIEALYKKCAPGGYGDEHISHYDRNEIITTAARFGFQFQEIHYVFRSEMIAVFTKQ